MRAVKTLILAAILILSLSGGVAHAQRAYNEPDDVVRGERFAKPKNPPFVIPMRQPNVQPQILPFTGADVTVYLILGLAAVGGGMLIVRRTRTN